MSVMGFFTNGLLLVGGDKKRNEGLENLTSWKVGRRRIFSGLLVLPRIFLVQNL
jgi:hypothetical protein